MQKHKKPIDQLVHWALSVEHVEAVVSRAKNWGPNISNTNPIMQMMQLGVRIDKSSFLASDIGNDCHEDALTIFSAINQLPEEAMVLITLHGRAGTQPDWHPEGAGYEREITDKRGRRKPIYKDPVNRNNPIGYKTEWVGTRPEIVTSGRKDYSTWYNALCELQSRLKHTLIDFTPALPSAQAAPWITSNIMKNNKKTNSATHTQKFA